MALTLTTVGAYPKPPPEGGEFRLRKTLQALDRGEATAEDVAAVAKDLAAAINEEARDLAAAGATVIQFDEPSLAAVPGQPPGDLGILEAVAQGLVDGVDATTILATYFGDVAAHGPRLFELP